MRSEKKTATSVLFILLTYVFIAGNTSGELALCIGSNWHIALEPIAHEHCYNRPHIEQNNPSSAGHEHEGLLESQHCKPCIDIPIFIGPSNNRLVLKPVKPNSNKRISHTECAMHNLTTDKWGAINTLPDASRRSYSAMEENRFLRSIILIV